MTSWALSAFGMAAILLGGCASMPGGLAPAAEGYASEDLHIRERTPLIAEEHDLIYQILVAEFAGVRGQMATSLDAYLTAMTLSEDPQLAARATRISIFANQDVKGLQAATRWVALSPEEPLARQALGLFLLRNGERDQAIQQFRELVLRSDDAASAFAQLGGGLGREEDQEAALAVLRSLAEAFPGVPEAHMVYAQAALRANDPQAAISAAEAGLTSAPDSRELATLRAQALIESGRTDEGIRAFEDLIERFPQDAELRLYLARMLLDARREDDALQQFRRVLLDRPNDASVLYATGLLTLDAGHPDMAKPYFLRLLEVGERTEEAYLFLGQIAEDEARPDDALGWYERVEGDNRLAATLRRAILLGNMGRLTASRDLLSGIRAQYPDASVRSYLVEGEVLRSNAQYDVAMAVFDESLSRHPGNVDLTYGRALVAIHREDIAAAERDLRTIIAREPDNFHALNALGYTLVDLTGRVNEGFELIRQAYALSPDNPAIVDSMGWAYYRLGNTTEALGYLRRAYALMPDAEVAAHLGEVLWVTGEREEARQIWRDAQMKAPDDSTLIETLQRLDP